MMLFLRRRSLLLRAWLLVAALGFGSSAWAQTKSAPVALTVLVSGAFEHAFQNLAPEYEKRSGTPIIIVRGPSMGETPNAIPNRLDRRETADVVIMAREALDRLAAAGKVLQGSQSDLVISKIAMAVKAEAPAPDISTSAALRGTLLAAKSIAYSDSASGVYISSQMFAKLGIADAMTSKARMIPASPVGLIVARGEAEIGFQQYSELKPIAGLRIVGFLPDDVQKLTRFSAGIVSYSAHADSARRLIAFLQSDAVHDIITESGLEPAAKSR